MSLESFHNYFGGTVKSRKNDEKFCFFSKNTEINFVFIKKIVGHPENGCFGDFGRNLRPFLRTFFGFFFWGGNCRKFQISEACSNVQILLSHFKIHYLEFWKCVSKVQIQNSQISAMVSSSLENFQNKFQKLSYSAHLEKDWRLDFLYRLVKNAFFLK